MNSCVIVVPCYNEARRLEPEGFLPLLAQPRVELLFVDDGSRDSTAQVLASMRALAPRRIDVLTMPHNVGKGEAVRCGMNRALEEGAAMVGYLDADLATPAAEMLRIYELACEQAASVFLGSRVKLLGRDIQRHAWRHYLGRIFATFASIAVALPVYDTQCGAKLFRASATLRAALREPFRARWVFDVELIGRLSRGVHGAPGLGVDGFVEVPLRRWVDVPGSKLRPRHVPRALIDLIRIAVAHRRRSDTLASSSTVAPPASRPPSGS